MCEWIPKIHKVIHLFSMINFKKLLLNINDKKQEQNVIEYAYPLPWNFKNPN